MGQSQTQWKKEGGCSTMGGGSDCVDPWLPPTSPLVPRAPVPPCAAARTVSPSPRTCYLVTRL